MHNFHFLRPGALILFLPFLFLLFYVWKKKSNGHNWSAICDQHLLAELLVEVGTNGRKKSLLLFFTAVFFIIFALAGPTWFRYPMPLYKNTEPRVILLSMADNMSDNDVSPDRLTRAKFILHDLFNQEGNGSFALIAYTKEPFVVSPLTEDAKTIDALLSSLTPSIMPVGGNNLSTALAEGATLIQQAGYTAGQILVLSSTPPEQIDLKKAKKLAQKHIQISIMPVIGSNNTTAFFKPLATAGEGLLLDINNNRDELKTWLELAKNQQQFILSKNNDIPLWRDEGPWFIIPALVLILPSFRRGWLQRLSL